MNTYGQPGEHAFHIADQSSGGIRYGTTATIALAGGLTTAGALWIGLSGVVVAAIALATVALAFVVAKKPSDDSDAAKARIGAVKEVEFADVLSRARAGNAVGVFGLQLGLSRGSRCDTDCTVSMESRVLAAVEIKTGFGKVSFDPRTRALTAGKRVIPGDPIAQAERNAADLQRLVGGSARVVTVVAVSDSTTDPFRVGDVYVSPSAKVPALLNTIAKKSNNLADASAHKKVLKLAKEQHKSKMSTRKMRRR